MQIEIPKAINSIMIDLVQDLKEVGDYKKIDNNPNYMPLFIEIIDKCNLGFIYSFAHYGLLNGDLMKDPEMTFLKIAKNDKFIPLSYQNDYLNVFIECINLDSGNIVYYQKRLLDQIIFTETWIKNIKSQQFLKC